MCSERHAENPAELTSAQVAVTTTPVEVPLGETVGNRPGPLIVHHSFRQIEALELLRRIRAVSNTGQQHHHPVCPRSSAYRQLLPHRFVFALDLLQPFRGEEHPMLFARCEQIHFEAINLRVELLDELRLGDFLVDFGTVPDVLGAVCVVQGVDSFLETRVHRGDGGDHARARTTTQ